MSPITGMSDKSDEGDKMDKATQAVQKVIEHRKTCQTCTNQVVCDKAAELNAKLLETVIFGQ